MKPLNFLIIFYGIIFFSCHNVEGNQNNLATSSSLPDQEIDIIPYLDSYCGYPGDPDLPELYIGATEEVLLNRDAIELFNILEVALPIAKEKLSENPRLLFEVGRAGYRLEYYEKAEGWINDAAQAGSVGALAWLGSYYYNTGEIQKGIDYIRLAVEEGFQARWAKNILSFSSLNLENENFYNDFGNSDVIKALWERDFEEVYRLYKTSGAHFYLKSLNETLINPEILFVVDAPNLLLDTRPELSNVLGSDQSLFEFLKGEKVAEFAIRYGEGKENAIKIASAVGLGKKDGYRLAMLYNTDYESFQHIYDALTDYCLKYIIEMEK